MTARRHSIALTLLAVVWCAGSAVGQRIASLEPSWSARQASPGPLTIASAPQPRSPQAFDPYQSIGTRIAQGPLVEMPWNAWVQPPPQFDDPGCAVRQWHLLPPDNIYPFYLADQKASRLGARFTKPSGDNLLLDTTLGGRVGIFRLGDSGCGPYRQGVQLDVEGSAQLRLDMKEDVDLRSVDFRGGLPLSFAFGRWHLRVGYYHLSSHLGDEFLLKNPTFERLNFSRDVLFTGAGFYLTERVRIYGEVGWAFYSDVSKQWEFEGGIECAPAFATGWRGEPYGALHLHSRQELDYGGSVNAQLGWAWRGEDGALLRLGLSYHEGKSPQWSFFDNYEPLIGIGLWYDR